MWQRSPQPMQRIALATTLLLLTSLTVARAEVKPDGVEWSLSTPPFEAGPRSFPAIAIHLQNRTPSPQTLRLHFDLGSLRSLSGRDLEVAVRAREATTVLYTLYIP